MDRAQAVVATMAVIAVGALAWTVQGLRGDVADLSQRLAAIETAPVTSSTRVPGSERPSLTPDVAQPLLEPGAEPTAVDPTDLEALVHRTVEQQTKEREAEATAKWLDRWAAWTEKRVEGLVADGVFEEAVAADVVSLLINEMHDGADLKTEVQSGRLAEDEGWAQWAQLREDNDAALITLVGQDGLRVIRDESAGK
ncbi:MAG: hypothetical protein KC912_20460 [Proteobacteria bacterium]|nr:hypothetical protein [Pseudomonadota bacterium]